VRSEETSLDIELDGQMRRMEALLRDAAEWEPGTEAPTGFVTRALARESRRNEPRPRAASFLGLALGGATATAALAGSIWAVSLPVAHAPRIVAVVPKQQATAEVRTSRPPAQVKAPAELPKTGRSTRRRARAVRIRRPKPGVQLAAHTPPPLVEAPIPEAQWATEVVETPVSGVVAPAFVFQPDPYTGGVLVQPGVIDIRTTAACSPDERDAPSPVEAPAAADTQEKEQ
jgi:hypothetical protein